MRSYGLSVLFLLALSLLSIVAARADVSDLDGGLHGFTTDGVMVGNQYMLVEVPFAPSLHDDRVILEMPALSDTPTPIFVPMVESDIDSMDALTVHYFNASNPVALMPTPVAAPPPPLWMQKIATRVGQLQKLAKKLDRIVNPKITTKNFDIKLNFFYHP